MQDRFVGDIGDFGKYGLLRALTGLWDWERGGALPEHKRLSLGVVWYRNEGAKGGPNEGQNVGYLFDPQRAPLFNDLDPDLFSCLKYIVCNKRNLEAIEASNILGKSEETLFYKNCVPKEQTEREKWFNDALDHIEDKDVVFLDPDTGIIPKFPKDRRKHIFLPEVDKIVNSERCQTIIAYQHYGHGSKARENQVNQWRNLKKEGTQEDPRILETSQRAFIILPAVKHTKTIDERLAKMLKSPWFQYFKILPLR